jgi:hypothetical protein
MAHQIANEDQQSYLASAYQNYVIIDTKAFEPCAGG